MATIHTRPADAVRTALNYFLPNPSGASLYHVEQYKGSSNTRVNSITDTQEVVIHNVRGCEQQFTLDRNGFQFLTHETTEKFVEQASIETNFYEEVRELLKVHTGAQQVMILGHRIRQSREDTAPDDAGNFNERPPAHSVHADRTPESAMADARQLIGNDEKGLLQGRVRFVNLWRPIDQTVFREPLAVADWQTSSDMFDLMPIYIQTPNNAFYSYVVRFNRRHQWYYLKHQTPSEIILIKCYDSRTDGVARLCMHSAFHDPESPSDAPKRRSIEVNTLVFG